MRILRLINYVGIILSVLIVFNMPVNYKVPDIIMALASGAIVIIGGYVFSYQEGPKTKVIYAISSVLLVFTLVNTGHYYPELNIVKDNIDLTIEIREQIKGWVLIVMLLFLILSVLFSSFLIREKEVDYKYESNLYD